jgi:pyocin large subunit-like protein
MAARTSGRTGLSILLLLALAFSTSAALAQPGSLEAAPGFNKAQARPDSSTSEAARFSKIRHPRIGFATQQKFLDHYEKHGREFGRISAREYLLMAQDLRDRKADRRILEFARRDGVVTRFDRGSGAFLAFNRNLTIRTFFKPNDGEAYFIRQRYRAPR